VSFESGFENHNWRGTDVRWQSVPQLRASNRKGSVTCLLKLGPWDLEEAFTK